MTDFDSADETSGLRTVFQSIDPMRVNMARDLLNGSGIEAFIFDSETSRMIGTTVAIVARLMVHADCADEARERLQELGFTD
jgi:putative signal transducing protein